MTPRAVRLPIPPGDQLVRSRGLLHEVRRHLEMVLAAGNGTGGSPGESPAARRGISLLVAELFRAATAEGWDEEAALSGELQRLLESPSRLVGLARKLRAGFAGLERRLWDRLTALRPALLSAGEWDRRVA